MNPSLERRNRMENRAKIVMVIYCLGLAFGIVCLLYLMLRFSYGLVGIPS